ncbi:MAG: hypothetical protein ACJARI_003430 [Bacteroidia bacterium]|jgi:hypothetical protein
MAKPVALNLKSGESSLRGNSFLHLAAAGGQEK